METSVKSKEFQKVLDFAHKRKIKKVSRRGEKVEISHPFQSPEDWRDHWIYFLMIDRFNDSKKNTSDLSPDGNAWTDPRLYDKFLGGNIKGITQKLDYLEALGAGAIWITPPFKNCKYANTYYGYGIEDFLNIDSRFGTEDDLIELVDQAHARGIYVIFDIVLNHAGNVFKYENGGILDEEPWSDKAYQILWTNIDGSTNEKYHHIADIPHPINPDLCVWPKELQDDQFFRRKGMSKRDCDLEGDFCSLKEFDTSKEQVRDTLIKAYQYAIAKFDIDGYRIDTLKHIEPEFARHFGNAIREFALSIGKKNFFCFGEVRDGDETIKKFIGRNTAQKDGVVGVDATLDFPLFFQLPSVIKGFTPPSDLASMFKNRKDILENIISTHADISQYLVTFLETHDDRKRFYCGNSIYNNQVSLAIATLFTLQGIPCLYYGSENGLFNKSDGDSDRAVRQALWMVQNGFDMNHPFYEAIQAITKIRKTEPALRYGRQYFREVSGDGYSFGISQYAAGILAYSRVLNDTEVLIIANTNTQQTWPGYVYIGAELNPVGKKLQRIYSNNKTGLAEQISANRNGWRSIQINLDPMEIQIWR